MKNTRKSVEERQLNILKAVNQRGEIKVEDLVELYGISAMTARRDLQYLEDRQMLFRPHGGAMSLERSRYTKLITPEIAVYRDKISRYASNLLEDGDTIFINASKTALGILKFVNDKHITAITNNGWVFEEQYPDNVSIHITGGQVRGKAMVGDYVMRNLLDMSVDKTFVGCAAVYDNGEFRYDIPTEIGINEAMISRTRESFYILADHTKLMHGSERSSLYGSFIYEQPVTLITDDMADPDILDRLRGFGMEIVVVS